eukprot:343103_1
MMAAKIRDHFKELERNEKARLVIKVSLLGNPGVGKRSLMAQLNPYEHYDKNVDDTSNMYTEISNEFKNVILKTIIWKICNRQYDITLVCDMAKVILFAFDLTQEQSLLSVKEWYLKAKKVNKRFIGFLVGLKYDLYKHMGDHHKHHITSTARKYSKKMDTSLILNYQIIITNNTFTYLK